MKIAISLFTLFFAFAVHSAPVTEWIPRSHRQASVITMKEGTAHITGAREAYVFSKQSIPLQSGKDCQFSGEFRCPAKGSLFFGLEFLDAAGKHIDGCEALVIPGTLTELVSEVKAGDRIVKVKDASRWLKRNGSVIAFNARQDLSDLPNRDLCRGAVTHIEKKNDVWEVTTRLPFRKNYPMGCLVRQQSGAPYVYAACGKPIQSDWQKISAVIKARQFYPGAASIRVVAFVFGQSPVLELRNVQLEFTGESK